MTGRWRCDACGYVYDPEVGDEEVGVPPETPIEDLPADWRCPECGAPKNHYERVD